MAAANSFTVFAGNRLLVVAASSAMEKNKWMEDLQAVIDQPENQLDSDQLRYASLKSNSESTCTCSLKILSPQNYAQIISLARLMGQYCFAL